MPEDFHSSSSFKSALKILKADLGKSSNLKGGKVDAPLLLFGLVYREISHAMEIEPGGTNKYPPQLNNSPFGIKEVNQLEKLLDGIVFST